MEYETYKKRLIEISYLTEKNDLDKALPGRFKYDPETLQPHMFEGISVIHNINQIEADALNLSGLATRFRGGVNNAGLGGKIAFVSLSSFHATTFDLINKEEHSGKLTDEGQNYKFVREAIEKAAIEFVNDIAPQIKGKVTIEKIGMFAPAVVKLSLRFNCVLKDVLHAYRISLNQYLVKTVPGYSIIRDEGWNEYLAGHITIGYVVDSMNEAEIESFLQIMNEFNNEFEPVTFDLTQGEVTSFTDMDHYSVVA